MKLNWNLHPPDNEDKDCEFEEYEMKFERLTKKENTNSNVTIIVVMLLLYYIIGILLFF